ncbi:hypothetical protein [Prosthecomicrobium hirschii]|uniref:hypothetical protein n=1 Tax=Prosthecodimorpha hirschii TaxID=665126 RepID=UPI002221254B|nr:hypothetical protein [Prosthecomicrobium hirschii]MCW1844206.1 hypothetical protein [Prosthecomicrobium hirschii]
MQSPEPPLFATDSEIGRALMGPRWKNFVSLAPLLEREGLPKIDPLMGGRYWPAVKTHFDRQHGLTNTIPLAPDGKEDFSGWKKRARRA